MCRNLLAIFFSLFFLSNNLNAQFVGGELEIKSLACYSKGNELSFPVIDYSKEEPGFITIEFDVASAKNPGLAIVFKYCNSNWQPYDSPFLTNPMYNMERNIFLERLPASITGASYHYKESFPNSNVNFPYSGKWIFEVFDLFNRGKVYAKGKFFVVYPEVRLYANIFKETLQGYATDNPLLARTIAIKTSFVIPDSLFSSNIKKIEIVKNRMFDSPIVIDRYTNSADRFYEWNASNQFSFVARNIHPGNEYRQIDLMAPRYLAANKSSFNAELETSDVYSRRRNDNNGSSDFMNYKNSNSDYVNIVFKLRIPEFITKPVFLVGSFTNWKLLPEFEMFDDKGLMNLSVNLKRGIHDYQYVVADYKDGKIINDDWLILEGNFWETDNEYNIFLYYETQEKGGYEKIIGFNKLKTGGL